MKDEMDILREVGTIAAAHASTALSTVLGKKINLYLPTVEILPADDIGSAMGRKDMKYVVENEILSGLEGKIVFILDEKDAYKFINSCCQLPDYTDKGDLTEVCISLIKEIDNIVISSYANALSSLLNKIIIPSLPVLINAPFETIARLLINDYRKEKYVMSINTVFEQTEEQIKGCFWILLTPKSVEEIKDGCKKILESAKNWKKETA